MKKTKTQEVNAIPVDQLILSTLQQILGMLHKFEGILISKPTVYTYPVQTPEIQQPATTCGATAVEQNTSAPVEVVGTPGTAQSGWDLVNKDHPTAHIQPASEKPVSVRKARAPKADKPEKALPVETKSEASSSVPSSAVHVPSSAALQPAADDFGLGL